MRTFLNNLFPFVDPTRIAVWERALALSVPSESFQYVTLSKLLEKKLDLPSFALEADALKKAILPECVESVLVFINGLFAPQFSRTKNLPSSFLIMPHTEAAIPFDTFLRGRFDNMMSGEQDPLGLFNYATFKEGLFAYLPAKTKLSSPLQVLHVYTEDFPYCAPRTLLFLGKQSACSLYVNELFLKEHRGWTNSAIDIVCEEGAELNLHMFFHEASSMAYTDSLRALLKKDALFKLFSLGKGKQLFRQDCEVFLHERAQALLNGAFLLDKKSECHIRTKVEHKEEGAFSLQKYKGVLKDQSRKSFAGKIHVCQKAQKTQAYQMNKNLLLSDFAHAYSKPNLEIYADDVKASHGATVGKLPEDDIFYLKARGLSEEKAKKLLVEAFMQEIWQQVPLSSAKRYAQLSP